MAYVTEGSAPNRRSTPFCTGHPGPEEMNGEMTETVRFAQTGQYRPVSPSRHGF
jgi:hypothetical protein